MNNRRITGFTLVELMLVIAITAILMALATGTFFYLQSQARDSERDNDATSIARALERMYVNKKVGDGNASTYPSTVDAATVFNASYFKAMGLDPEILYSPNNDAEAKNSSSTYKPCASSSFTTSVCIATNVPPATILPTPTNDLYIYQPIDRNGNLCTAYTALNPCVKFNLYYQKESATATTPNKITSINQQ